MLTVTATAKDKFKEALEAQTKNPEIAIRVVPSSSNPKQLELVLDKEKEGDQVVRTEGDKKVLLIGADLVSELEKTVIDYKETPKGKRFTIMSQATSP